MKKLIIIFAAIAMVASFTATAMADVELYGSARFRTFWQDVDPGGGADDDSDLEWRMGHLSRFGANFKSDKITGKFELDARAATIPQPNGQPTTQNIEADSGSSGIGDMRLRHLWGEYDFGTFKLMIGQNFPLFDAPVSSINYYSGGLQPLGGMGYTDARTSQLRLTMGNLRIAFLPPDTSLATSTAALPIAGDVDTTIPKIEVRYDMKLGDTGEINLIGGYQTFDFEGTVGGIAVDDSVDSYVLGIRGKFNFGPAYLGAGVSYRVNGGPYDVWTVSPYETPVPDGNGGLEDGDAIGAVVALGYKVSDMLTLEASYAKLMAESDSDALGEDDTQTFALQAKFTVAPGVFIIPEFIFQDNEDIEVAGVDADQGDQTAFGVFWMINFN